MYKCQCWHTQLKWSGQCPKCKEWNTLHEDDNTSNWTNNWKKWKAKETTKFTNYSNNIDTKVSRQHFWSNELNTVLWGWLMQWSLILLSWEPGIGKSTLTLQMTDWFTKSWKKSLYVSCEENMRQVFERAKRMKIENEYISFLHEWNLENILATLEENDAELAIIDSISMIYSDNVSWVSGWVSQIKHVSDEFMKFTKRTWKSVILIWHISKDGDIAWPKKLEHVVDVVLFMEWDRYESYRILRSLKNRFWPTDEIWLFQMTEVWFIDLPNPWLEFLSWKETIGNAIGVTMEGTRALLIDLEALSVKSKFWYAKRSSRWIPQAKTDQMIAILSKYLQVWMDEYDCYINVWHGMNLKDPAIDLALIASIYSSIRNISISKIVFLWEVSLTWIVKTVPQLNKRVEECIKLGFEKIVVPKGSYKNIWKNKAVKIQEIEYIKELKKIIIEE